jgi:hypothetical protein
MSKAEQLQDLQVRHKALAAERDSIIREVGVYEQKLEAAYEQLRKLGIETPEEYTAKELETLGTELETKLGEKIAAITELLEQGEALLAQYQEA